MRLRMFQFWWQIAFLASHVVLPVSLLLVALTNGPSTGNLLQHPQLTPGHLLTPSIKPFYACRRGISRVKPEKRYDSKFMCACVNSMKVIPRVGLQSLFLPHFLGQFHNVQLKNSLKTSVVSLGCLGNTIFMNLMFGWPCIVIQCG